MAESLEIFAEQMAAECEVVGRKLAVHASRLGAIRALIDLFSVFVGLLALLMLGAPQLSRFLPTSAGPIALQAAPVILVVGVLFDRLFFRDPPDRFRDYGDYISNYAYEIRLALARGDVASEAELRSLLQLAQRNINDARIKWPSLLGTA